jgi:hypothetical protein
MGTPQATCEEGTFYPVPRFPNALCGDRVYVDAILNGKNTNYDRADASRRIAATGFPNTPEFDMLNPPSSEKMLELCSKAELKS